MSPLHVHDPENKAEPFIMFKKITISHPAGVVNKATSSFIQHQVIVPPRQVPSLPAPGAW